MLCRRSMSVARSYCISLQLGCVQKSSKHRTYARRQYLPCHGVRYNQKKNNEKKWKSHGPGASLWEKKPTNNWLWRKKNSPPRESIKKKRCFSSPAEVWCISSFIQRNYILCACILDDSWALFFLSIFIDRTVAPLLCDKMGEFYGLRRTRNFNIYWEWKCVAYRVAPSLDAHRTCHLWCCRSYVYGCPNGCTFEHRTRTINSCLTVQFITLDYNTNISLMVWAHVLFITNDLKRCAPAIYGNSLISTSLPSLSCFCSCSVSRRFTPVVDKLACDKFHEHIESISSDNIECNWALRALKAIINRRFDPAWK